MSVFYFVWIGFVLLLLLYRLKFQKFKKYQKENIGLSAILIIFTGSGYSTLDWNKTVFFGIIAIAVCFLVWNSILFARSEPELERLK